LHGRTRRAKPWIERQPGPPQGPASDPLRPSLSALRKHAKLPVAVFTSIVGGAMCDEEVFARHAPLEWSRREFGALPLGAGLSLLLPRAANAVDVVTSEVDVRTPDGVADCHFVHPVSGKHPAVLVWP